jgi:hypothetical protein
MFNLVCNIIQISDDLYKIRCTLSLVLSIFRLGVYQCFLCEVALQSKCNFVILLNQTNKHSHVCTRSEEDLGEDHAMNGVSDHVTNL